MRMRRTRATGSFTALLADLFGSRQQPRARRLSRLAGAERFEERKLLALTVTSIGTPPVGAENVDPGTDLVFTFNENVLKGQGNIYVVEQDAGQVGLAVDVRSSGVTIAGNQVRIDLPADLLPDNTYSVFIDQGAFIDTSSTPTAGATLLTQNFDFVALQPFVNEAGGDGTDFSTTPQFGFDFQTTLDPARGISEWRGWSFADKESWIAADNQGRDQFALGSGTVMVADTDEYDDGNAAERPWVGYSYTPVIDLTGVAANSVKLEFDSSFRPEGPGDSQVGTIEVTYDGGTTWAELLRLDEFNTSNAGANTASRNINERLVSGTATGVSADSKGGAAFGAVTNPSSGTMQFRFWVTGTNDWWWAIDNMKISGDIVGVPYAGLSDATAWTFSTPESPKFTLAIDASAINENGGTATATLSRNVGPLVPDGEIVVSLASSDESELTVPATVTIPAGQTSVTFPITAVDDALADRVQRVTITAALDPFRSATAELAVLDDEGPKVVSVTPGYDATGASYQSNLSVTFDRAVKKGAGIIRVVRTATGVQVAEVDVADPNVVVSGTTMTVELPDLPGLTEFSVLLDDGVVVSTSTDLFPYVVLMQENFDALPLLSFADSLVGPEEGDGTDYTFQNPIGFSVDNSLMPVPAGTSPFEGWSYMDKNSWVDEQNDQSRARFTLGSGVVAVADGDAWTDYPRAENSYMTTFLVTRPVDLTGITAGSVSLQFDSSFYQELPQFGTVEVTYDGGLSWNPLLFFGDENVPGIGDGASRNERISVDSTKVYNDIVGSAIVDAPLFNPDSGTLQFRFGYQNAGNNWWWAVDNIVVRGERAGEPFAGLVGDAWSFTTGEAPTLSVSFDPSTVSEKGTATATVTRNLNLTNALTVALVSSDLSAATVPATVTIPAGQASATFTVTAVDDTVTDGDQVAVIAASAAGFFAGEAALTVADDDFPQLLSATPAPGSAGAAVDGPLTLVFDQEVQKGNGFISIVDAATGKAVESISVLSSSVTVVGDRVTVTRSERLVGLTQYAVRIDPGAVLAAAPGVSENVPLLWQDFELLPLGPAVDEDPAKGDGTDWTATPPADWVVDNSNMPAGGKAEYSGWTFLDKSVWQAWSGQSRSNFTLASGTIAVADTDEWDDKSHDPGDFNGILRTPVIDLATVTSSAVTIEFDSSFRPEGGGGGAAEGNQTGVVEVTFDGGATWTNLLTQDGNTSDGSATNPSVNRHEVLTATIPAGASTMQVRFGQIGSNDYWWAIDNVRISGTVESTAFPGILDAQTFQFTTEDAAAQPVLESFSVVGGTASADVSAPITLAFNQPMRAGNGFIHLVEAASGKAVESFNVATDVVFTGDYVVITPTARLGFETGYFVKIDQGALLTVALEIRTGVPVLLQDFELLPLGRAVDEDPAKGDGTDWTATPPADWVVDNANMPVGGKAEYTGWTFLEKSVWQAWSGQSRSNFTLASGTIAVADTDEWDDKSHAPGDFNGILETPVIDLATVTSSAVTIEFDSSFRPEGGGGGAAEGNQTGVVEVTFDGGATWTNLLKQDGNTSDGSATNPSVNRHEVLTATIPAGASTMQVRFGQIGSNDYWWAIDNLRFTADVNRWAFEGVSEATTVAFTTMADIIPDLVSVTPASGATGMPVDGSISMTFDADVKKGNGFIHVIDAATGKAVESISVLSNRVTVSGATVTVDPAADLAPETTYFLQVDRGALLGTTATQRANVPLLWQDFELLPLGPAVDEDPAKGDGTDWTATPPADWVVDNSNMPAGGKAEYSGWTFLDKTAWQAWSGQSRSNFTLASGTIAVADTDEWDDKSHDPGDFNGILRTPVIDLATVTSSAVTIEFDSSFRPEGGGGGAAEGNQTGVVEVTFDGGATWTNLLTQDGNTSTGSATHPSVNRHEVLTATIPAGASTMQVRFGQIGSNDYWWAIDNVEISATVNGYEFVGISGQTAHAFTTAAAGNETVVEVGTGQTVTDTVVHSGDETIVKTGSGTLVIDLANTHTGGLVVQAGTVILRNVAALNGGPLTVAAGAKVVVDTGTSRINLSDLALDPAGSLELGRAGVVVASGGFNAAAVRQALVAGRNGGGWNGAAGITSAAAASTAGRAVGYIVGGDGRLTVGFAALGDANMDGQFNPFDLVAMQSGGVFNTGAASSWQTGDFNYDGVSNVVDLVGANGSGVYGQGNYNVAPAGVQVVSASVPVASSAATAPSLSSGTVNQLTFAALSAEQDRASSGTVKKKAFATL